MATSTSLSTYDVETFERFEDEHTQHDAACRGHRRDRARHRRARRLCRRRRRGDGDGEGDDVTLTWWHNATSGPLPAVWEEVAAEFEEANPGVTVEQTGYQNEELQRTLIPNALSAGDPPDLFQVWPGGEIRDQVENGYLMPLDDVIGDTISSVGATVNPWQVDGETYAVPFTFGIEGFWYNTDLFERGRHRRAARDARRAQGRRGQAPRRGDHPDRRRRGRQVARRALVVPVRAALLLARDARRPRPPTSTSATRASSTPASELEDFIGINPFQDGFLGTPAQTGAGSSAGLVANGQAAMELMGHWNAGVIGGLTPDEEVPRVPRLVPVPRHRGRGR